MAAVASVGGIVSGIDVDGIIAKLSALENKGVQQLQTQQTQLKARQSAYQAINTRLSALHDAAASLARGSFFSAWTATTDDATIVATASSGAAAGDYQITVGAVARAHQVVTQSFGDVDATRLGTGTFTVNSGGQATSVTLDASNNTLGGLRDAINAANSNVRASIIQDGDASYRLMLSSKTTGVANGLSLTSSLTGGTAPTFSDLQTAADASVTLGSGPSALTVTRSTNTISDLIPGVTLNLPASAAGKTVRTSVTLDHEAIKTGVQNFVDQYNNALDAINQQFKFDSTTGTGGALLGDFTLQGIQNQLGTLAAASVSGLAGAYNSLADVGIATGVDGKLALNAGTFETRLSADPESVTRLFALTGRSTNAAVQFVGATSKTQTDATAFSVDITQAARQARVTAGVAQTGALAADETLTINGATVALTAGMSLTQVTSAINAHSRTTGVIARATAADGTGTGTFLSLFTTSYGAAAHITAVSSLSNGSADSSGLGNLSVTEASAGGEGGAGTGVAGLDVMGTIDGEAATGTGQVLVGAVGNAHTEGLRLLIASDTTGNLGTIQIFGGAAHVAATLLDRITDAISGPIQTEQDQLDRRILDLQKTVDERNAEVTRHADDLRAKFNSMETILSQLQNQGAYLTSQFAAMNGTKNS